MLASNRLTKGLSLLSVVLIVSLLIWAGSQALNARQSETDSTLALDERISIVYDAETGVFETSGWTRTELQQMEAYATADGSWSDVLSIHIALPDEDSSELPSVTGDYNVDKGNETLIFEPRFGWSPGQAYIAILELNQISDITRSEIRTEDSDLEWSFWVPASEAPAELPTVTTIYPTADEVPENLLRFYIEFSQPMQRGNVYDVVQLLNANGDAVEWPFLRIGQEFWDRDMRVLTIILDPGRIKQGVAPNVEAGAPLTSEGSYQLVIGEELRDAYGRPLEAPIVKTFIVGTPDYQSPEPTTWILSSPTAGTHEALTISLDDEIDPIIAPRLIRVEDDRGQSVSTEYTFSDDEQTLYLAPTEPWSGGLYQLAVLPTLEDYAGNRIESLFDMAPGTVADLEAIADEREAISLEFQIE